MLEHSTGPAKRAGGSAFIPLACPSHEEAEVAKSGGSGMLCGMSSEPRPPEPRQQTLREALRQRLREGQATAKELSAAVGMREKDVEQHLSHLERSLKHDGEALVVEPARCIACGFAFSKRTRLSRPGRCPECDSTRIDPPVFSIRAEER